MRIRATDTGWKSRIRFRQEKKEEPEPEPEDAAAAGATFRDFRKEGNTGGSIFGLKWSVA